MSGKNEVRPITRYSGEKNAKKTYQPLYVTFSAVIASVGGVLFGYDIGITSGALLQLKKDFQLTPFEQEMVVSSVLIGAFVASFFGGNIVDGWGRKAGIAISSLLFIVGALILAFSVNFVMLVSGRLIVGVAVSLSVTAECTYISEISPPSRRGMMVSLNEVGITVGFLLAYLINYLFITTPYGWKYMFGAAAVPAFLQGIGVVLLPNSHYYLLIKGEIDKARDILSRLRSRDNVDDELNSIISSIEEQKDRKYRDLFSSISNMRSRMALGMALVFLQQFSGHANVLYYAPTVFQLFGYNNDSLATLVTVGLGVVKVISTVVTLTIVDKVGRRSLLLIGCLLMATSIIILGIIGTITEKQTSSLTITQPESNDTLLYEMNNITENIKSPSSFTTSYDNNLFTQDFSENYFSENNTTSIKTPSTSSFKSSVTPSFGQMDYLNSDKGNDRPNLKNITEHYDQIAVDNGLTQTPIYRWNESINATMENRINNESYTDINMMTKITSVISLMTFVCAYAMSYGPVTWLVLSEIFPGSLRGRAVSVATCINWGSNIIVSLTFLDVLKAIGIGPTFVMYGFISYAAALFVFFCVPETKNKTLEEIDDVMTKGLLQENLKSCSRIFKSQNRPKNTNIFTLNPDFNEEAEQKNSFVNMH